MLFKKNNTVSEWHRSSNDEQGDTLTGREAALANRNLEKHGSRREYEESDIKYSILLISW